MTKVVFLGPKGTFTHQACLTHYEHEDLSYQMSIQDIFSCIEHRKADLGVLPIENSTEGMVTHTLDCLLESDLKICKEIVLPISHNLFIKNRDTPEISKIISHPQAFAQCKAFLRHHFSDATCILAPSTSRAIEMMLDDPQAAAIAGPQAIDYFDIHIQRENIQDKSNNTTRFLVISREVGSFTGQAKTSLMLALDDQPGTLVNLLNPFALLGINLTKIESRPEPGKVWSNVFFIDLIGHFQDEKVQVALSVLKAIGVQVKHLGSYPCNAMRD